MLPKKILKSYHSLVKDTLLKDSQQQSLDFYIQPSFSKSFRHNSNTPWIIKSDYRGSDWEDIEDNQSTIASLIDCFVESRYDILVLHGQNGCGKKVLSRKISINLWEQYANGTSLWLPLRIINNINENAQDLLNVVLSQDYNFNNEQINELEKQLLQDQDKALIIIQPDFFSELKLKSLISQLLQKFKNTLKFIILTEQDDYEFSNQIFVLHMDILNFDDGNIKEYLLRHLFLLAEINFNKLIDCNEAQRKIKFHEFEEIFQNFIQNLTDQPFTDQISQFLKLMDNFFQSQEILNKIKEKIQHMQAICSITEQQGWRTYLNTPQNLEMALTLISNNNLLTESLNKFTLYDFYFEYFKIMNGKNNKYSNLEREFLKATQIIVELEEIQLIDIKLLNQAASKWNQFQVTHQNQDEKNFQTILVQCFGDQLEKIYQFFHFIENSKLNIIQLNCSKNNLTTILKILVERLKIIKNIKEKLIQIVKLSALYPRIVKASSNSLFLLCYLSFSLHNIDFSYIQINDVCLHNGRFLKSNLSWSKFNNVDVSSCNFNQADLSHIIWIKKNVEQLNFELTGSRVKFISNTNLLTMQQQKSVSQFLFYNIKSGKVRKNYFMNGVPKGGFEIDKNQFASWIKHRIYIKNFTTGKTIRKLILPDNGYVYNSTFVFSNQGKYLAFHSSLFLVHVISMLNASQIQEIQVPKNLKKMKFLDNGFSLALAYEDLLEIIEIQTQQRQTYVKFKTFVYLSSKECIYSRQQFHLLQELCYFDLQTRQTIYKICLPYLERLQQFNISNDCRNIAITKDHDQLLLLDSASKNVRQLSTDKANVRDNQACAPQFSPDGTMLSYEIGNKTWLWNIENERFIQNTQSSYRKFDVYKNEDILAITNGYRKIELWDLKTLKKIKIVEGMNRYIFSVAFSNDGNLLAAGQGEKTIVLWDLRQNQRFTQLSSGYKMDGQIKFIQEDKYLAHMGHVTTVWDLQKMSQVLQIRSPFFFDNLLLAFKFNLLICLEEPFQYTYPSEEERYKSKAEDTIVFINYKLGQRILEIADKQAQCFTLSKSENLLAYINAKTYVSLFDVRKLQTIPLPKQFQKETNWSGMCSIKFSIDETLLVVSESKTFLLLDITTLSFIKKFQITWIPCEFKFFLLSDFCLIIIDSEIKFVNMNEFSNNQEEIKKLNCFQQIPSIFSVENGKHKNAVITSKDGYHITRLSSKFNLQEQNK